MHEKSQHDSDREEFSRQLSDMLCKLRPAQSEHHSTKQKIFVQKKLNNCSHVYVRVDRVQPPLQPAYSGPYPVLQRHEKYFTILMNGKEDTVTIDRLKPAYTPKNELTQHPVCAPERSKSGRLLRFRLQPSR